MSIIGRFFLAAVFLFCSFATILGLLALKLELTVAERVLFWAKRAVVIAIELSVGLLIFLVVAFLTNDFSIAVVAKHSSTDLPLVYKITAVWASSPGSLLIWFTVQFMLFGLWLAFSPIKGTRIEAACLSIGTAICLVFCGLLLFILRPFAPAIITSPEGAGLNPILRNFWMVIHPPLLFIGYSIFLIPFVMVTGACLSGRVNLPLLYQQIRKWLLLGVCFLGLGILTGAKWAYLETGWGGYWAWDPVESTSLLPWLCAMAALHSVIAIPLSQKFRIWVIALAPTPFILCLLATFITRSGILKSVHAYSYNAMAIVLLVSISLSVALWLICIIRATRLFTVTPSQVAGLHSITGRLFFWANIVFILTAVIIAGAIFWPVISPVIVKLFSIIPIAGLSLQAHTTSVPRQFYDRVMAGSAIILALLLGLAQLSILQQRRYFLIQALACCAAGLFSFGIANKFASLPILLSLACSICAFSFVAIFMNILSNLKAISKLPGQIAHLGVLGLLLAVGFSYNEQAVETTLAKGEKAIIAGYEITYDSFQQKSINGIIKAGPQFILKKKPSCRSSHIVNLSNNKQQATSDDKQILLWPYKSIYPNGQSTAEVAIHTTLLRDIYLSFIGVTDDGQIKIAVKAKPMMFWVWLAALLIIMGSATAVLFRRQRTEKTGR